MQTIVSKDEEPSGAGVAGPAGSGVFGTIGAGVSWTTDDGIAEAIRAGAFGATM